ncbi:MAG TPA: hypothetical protein VFT91_06585, partial [Dehalococcoidia bacterium]|nr:hypothetical protein [Dehalococcoidia bacterium]
LTALSDALRVELAGSGVSVSTVFPGLTETPFEQNMLHEMEMPEPPAVLRHVAAAAVARRIAQAIRWRLRDAYVSPEDLAAVGLNTLAPQLVDWGFRLLWLGSWGLAPANLALPPAEEPGEPSPADAEPPVESP